MRSHTRFAGLLCVAILVGLVAVKAAPGQAAVRQQADAVLSPEEAVIQVKPLLVGATEVPDGYTLGATTVDTPFAEALRQAAAGADPYAALDNATAEGTQACSVQALATPTAAPLLTATFTTCLMTDPGAAQHVVADEARAIDATSATLAPEAMVSSDALGDSPPTLWRLTPTAGGQQNTQFVERWARGQVAFELRARVTPGKEDPAATTALSKTLDVAEATRPTPVVGPATVAPPVDEAHRLFTTLNAQTAYVPETRPPTPTSRLLSRTAQQPVEAVLNASDPRATLRLLDQTFRRIIFVNEVFRTADRSFLNGQRVTVDADVAGAMAELLNPNSGGFFTNSDANDQPLPNATQTDTELAPPVQLGDATRAYKTLLSYPDPRNNFATYNLRWTRGSVVLQARIGANESRGRTIADALPWAQQVDQVFLASSLASMSRLPGGVTAPLRLAHAAGVANGGPFALRPTGNTWTRRRARRVPLAAR